MAFRRTNPRRTGICNNQDAWDIAGKKVQRQSGNKLVKSSVADFEVKNCRAELTMAENPLSAPSS